MRIQVVVGGQAGSEAKGAVAGYLAARQAGPMACVRVAGPNAGHTVVNPQTGVRHALRQIPVGAVTNRRALLCIAAGSEIEPAVLYQEVEQLEADGIPVMGRLIIDPAATILTDEHKSLESQAGLTGRIGSTGKGIGAARAARIMRTATTARDTPEVFNLVGKIADVASFLRADDYTIQVEGTQGYQLGLHTSNYPQVTSSDCTALDMLALARVNPWWLTRPEDLQIWLVFRPYPIRVAGNSGRLPGETSWSALGLPEEVTTVTKKTRRVGVWDRDWAQEAIEANTGEPYMRSNLRLALTMADQVDPALAGVTSGEQLSKSEPYQRFLSQFMLDCGQRPSMVTTSDRTYVWTEEQP